MFVMTCGVVTCYTRVSGLRAVVVCPPLAFFAGTVLAQVLTAPDTFSAAEGILVTLGSSALWLFTGTALVVAIALGRGYRPERARDTAAQQPARGAEGRLAVPVGARSGAARGLGGVSRPGAVRRRGSGGTELARERERHVLLHRLDFLHGAEPVAGELVQHRGHQFLRHRGPAGHADRRHAVQPALVDLAGVVDQVGGRAP